MIVHLCEAMKLTGNAKSYSEDLRWRIVWQCHLQHKSVEAIARDLYLLPRSVEHWLKSSNATGNVSPKESRHVPSRKLSEFEELFFRLCSIAPVSICRFCTKCRVGCLK